MVIRKKTTVLEHLHIVSSVNMAAFMKDVINRGGRGGLAKIDVCRRGGWRGQAKIDVFNFASKCPFFKGNIYDKFFE